MKEKRVFYALGYVKDQYIEEMYADQKIIVSKRPAKRIWLMAAIVAIIALLVGCTIAYTNGWFADFFSSRSEEPLSDNQLEYIKNNEQIIQETKADAGWTVELKSTITDGNTGFILFSVTAPEDIDLEANILRGCNREENETRISIRNGRFQFYGPTSISFCFLDDLFVVLDIL